MTTRAGTSRRVATRAIAAAYCSSLPTRYGTIEEVVEAEAILAPGEPHLPAERPVAVAAALLHHRGRASTASRRDEALARAARAQVSAKSAASYVGSSSERGRVGVASGQRRVEGS